jgi:hypothetical protein
MLFVSNQNSTKVLQYKFPELRLHSKRTKSPIRPTFPADTSFSKSAARPLLCAEMVMPQRILVAVVPGCVRILGQKVDFCLLRLSPNQF